MTSSIEPIASEKNYNKVGFGSGNKITAGSEEKISALHIAGQVTNSPYLSRDDEALKNCNSILWEIQEHRCSGAHKPNNNTQTNFARCCEHYLATRTQENTSEKATTKRRTRPDLVSDYLALNYR